MTSTKPLESKTALVTGASSGIGRAIALELAHAGAHVFLTGRTAAAMEDTRKEIQETGDAATVITADVRDVEQVRALVDAAVDSTGRLDIMVNNAGLSYPASILEGDPEEWRSMLETNVLALLVGCQSAVRAMRICGAEGHVVNISSVAAERRNSGVYGSTKHAVNAISATLREELENDTIRVTNVMPGAIATNFARNFEPEFIDTMGKLAGMDLQLKKGDRMPPEALDSLAENMKQMLGHPRDVAKAVLYAVTQPIEVNIADIVVRPPKAMTVPH
jgi:NADP-dependent 3-hydroxy acid dehydrogenase YdfG